MFRSNWDPNLVSWDGSKLSFTVEKRSDGSLYGAELRTNSHWYGYGCVSACMKPIPVSGIITSLFTYTGNFDGIGGSAPNHNEIDIEFEGKDTTIVQFNYCKYKALSSCAQLETPARISNMLRTISWT